MRVPDSPTAITAYRVWGVTAAPGGPRLQSTAAGFWAGMPAWEPHARFEARCLVPRRCPDGGSIGTRHGCGIYGLKSLDAALEWGRHIARVRSQVVVGEVSLWGTVVECELGWRAQFAYPASLVELVTGRRRAPVDLAPLASAYGVTRAA